MAYTTSEVAIKLNVPRETAYKLVSFMKELGMIKVARVRPNPAGKGKGSEEFEFPADSPAKLASLVTKLL